MKYNNATIVAISTSLAANSGINVIRLSGESSFEIAKKVFTCKNLSKDILPNYMYLGTVSGNLFKERAFCVFYKAPKSYTGEDLVEFQCHGGKGIATAILHLLRENGARPAEPGEFTKRAFLNEKMTLQEAEGVLEMINATSEAEINNAYKLMSGEVSRSILEMENLLIKTVAMLEAKLDYPEELEEETAPIAYKNIMVALGKISGQLESAKLAKSVKDGVNIAIVGVPNAGKSSLLNALIKEDRAIVTDIEGTTRDVVSESIELGGLKLNFLDTAGIREEKVDIIEKIGIERTKNAIKGAEIVIFVKDGNKNNFAEEEKIKEFLDKKKVIEVINKADIKSTQKTGLEISALTGENLNELIAKILELAGREKLYSQTVITNERQIFALQATHSHLKNAAENYYIVPTECTLLDLKSALEELCKITGNNATESVIEEVFSAFCVGK